MTKFCIKVNPNNRSLYKIYKENKSNGTMDELKDKYIINKFVHDTIVSYTTGVMTDISLDKSMKVSYGIVQINENSSITETFGDDVYTYNEYLRILARYRPERQNTSSKKIYVRSFENFEKTKIVLIKAANFLHNDLCKLEDDGLTSFIRFNILTSSEFIKAMLKEREMCMTVDGNPITVKYNLLRGPNIRFSEAYGSTSRKAEMLLSAFETKLIME